MRKKLLALLMCATMVLGSSAVAFAAQPSEANYTAAATVFSQGSKFDAEYEGKKVVSFLTYDSKGVASKWGLTATDNTTAQVKLGATGAVDPYTKADIAGKALTSVAGLATKDFAKDGDEYVAVDGTVLTAGKTAYWLADPDKAVAATADDFDAVTPTTDGAVDTNREKEIKAKNPSVTTDSASVSIVQAKRSTDKTEQDFYAYKATGGASIIVDNNNYSIGYLLSDGTFVPLNKQTAYSESKLQFGGDGLYNLSGSQVYVENAGTTALRTYAVDADGYILKLDSAANDSLVKADASSVKNDDGSSNYYVILEQYKATYNNYSRYLRTVAYAIADGTLSDKAVAVRARLYKLDTVTGTTAAGSVDPLKYLKSVSSTVDNTTITLNTDTLSRTNLKSETGLSVYTIDNSDAPVVDGAELPRLKSLGTTDNSGKYTITLNDFTDQVLIFDGYTAESNNDGVADDTTTTAATTAAAASTTAASSPKTGDVAPIAALAVVMMGACGAMVVASKKRA